MICIQMDSQSYFYFSFGSNMLTERIRLNDPNAMPYAAARLNVCSVYHFPAITLKEMCLNLLYD